MRKKIIIGVILLMIICLGVFIYCNVNVETEYTPEQEIEDIAYRNTVISLYFQNKETKELQIETRLIDSKELLKNPYNKLVTLLLEGPQSESFENVIPTGTALLGTILEGDCLVVNFSKEFMENQVEDVISRTNSIYSVVNTLTELKEVNSVKFLIDGNEVDEFMNAFCKS